MAQVLTWGGALLLLVGGMLLYPYVDSRLAVSLPTPTPTPPYLFSAENVYLIAPIPTVASATRTSIPTPSPTSSALILTPFPALSTPVAPPTPSPTPTPALPTRIVIPTIGVNAPVVPVPWQVVKVDGQTQAAAWEVPAVYAAGWHETSAPLGAPGNTVLNGHNTANGQIFRYLYTLEPGDVITVLSGDTPYTYAVTEIVILPEAGQPLELRRENARYILPTEDERLTLITCHPYGSLRYRLVVIAHPKAVKNDQWRWSMADR